MSNDRIQDRLRLLGFHSSAYMAELRGAEVGPVVEEAADRIDALEELVRLAYNTRRIGPPLMDGRVQYHSNSIVVTPAQADLIRSIVERGETDE